MKKEDKAVIKSKDTPLEEYFTQVTPLDDIVCIPVENLEDLQCLKKALEDEMATLENGSTQLIKERQEIYSCHRLLRILSSVVRKHGIDLDEKK